MLDKVHLYSVTQKLLESLSLLLLLASCRRLLQIAAIVFSPFSSMGSYTYPRSWEEDACWANGVDSHYPSSCQPLGTARFLLLRCLSLPSARSRALLLQPAASPPSAPPRLSLVSYSFQKILERNGRRCSGTAGGRLSVFLPLSTSNNLTSFFLDNCLANH